jgi:asparagine synthase (glutamine-hydrolysing)
MCGIALSIGSANARVVVNKILGYQKYRGPDNTSLLAIENEEGYIGHNRLNIVDQNQGSNQPFISSCGNYIISFNGEIYNYKEIALRYLPNFKFKTKSDTEVLLELWVKQGQDCLNHLIGMFAFIIYSKIENKIFIVRDRYGVKPAYYHSNKGIFTVGSEVKSLSRALSIHNELDLNIVKIYIEFGLYDSLDEKTHIKEIKKIPAGSILTYKINERKLEIKRYWNYELISPKTLSKKAIDDVNAEIYELLNDAIRIRTNSSVPFVVNMSGGVDSGALLALLKLEEKKTNNEPFLCYYAEHSGADASRETKNLKFLLNRSNNKCRKIVINFDDLKNKVDELVNICDGPIGGFATLGYYQLHKAIQADGFRLAIDGQGADEVFIGYDKYLLNNNRDIHVDGTLNSYFRIFSANLKSADVNSFSNNHLQVYDDLFYEKLPRNLRMNDRLSMACSVELRSPFLDHRLFEKTFSLPRKIYTANSASLKFQLKNIYSNYYEESLPKKNGKVTNQTESLLGKNYPIVESSLENLSSIFHGEIDIKRIKNELMHYRTHGIDNSFQLWRLIVSNSIIELSKSV